MADPIPSKSGISLAQVVRGVFATALFYSMVGGTEAMFSPSRHISFGIERACLLLAAGIAPLVVLTVVNRGKLTPGESRACMVGAGLTSLVLLPLLGLIL